MNGLRCAGTVCLAALSAGCVHVDFGTRSTSSIEAMYEADDRPDCVKEMGSNLNRVRHARPVVGLFVGVADYDEQSGYGPTPAHAISAAMFREPFFLTADNSEKNDLRLATSLRLDVRDELARPAARTLGRLGGMSGQVTPPPAAKDIGSGQTTVIWDIVRGAESTRRQGLLDSVDQALRRSENVALKDGSVVFLFYVSAHGKLGADGHAYIVPSDGRRDSPESWLDQREVLARIAAFLGRSHTDSRDRKAVIVFDICQRSSAPEPRQVSTGPLRGLWNAYVVESTSPGSYAWHWQVETQTRRTKEVVSNSWMGIPLPTPRPSSVEERFESNMSVMPLVSNCVISSYFKDQLAASISPGASKPLPMTVYDWLGSSRDNVPLVAGQIEEAQRMHARQNMRLAAPSTQVPFALLRERAP